MRALFDEREIIDLTEPLPDFHELRGEQFAKQWADADISKIIAPSSNLRAVAGIVAMFGMIKRLLHEPGEWLGPVIVDLVPDYFDQLGAQSENVERPTPNVQRPTLECLIGR